MPLCAQNTSRGKSPMTIKTLANLIATVESSNNPRAVRFEPTHKPQQRFIALLVDAIHCSEDTARMFCMSSWGLYQIMGDELVSQGFRGWPGDYCENQDVQLLHFSEFCSAAGIDYSLADVVSDSAKRLNFATHYNGPGMPQVYANNMLTVYKANQS
jgi:hypothetical protein